jgi:hypothetical protein
VHDQKPDPLPLASEIVAGIPRPLAQVLQQALALDSDQRFVSVKAFWEALPTLPAHEGVVAPAFSTHAAEAFATSPIQEGVVEPASSLPVAEAITTSPIQEEVVAPAFSTQAEDEGRALLVRRVSPGKVLPERRKKTPRPWYKVHLLRGALLCALLFLLLSSGVWVWVTSSGHTIIPTIPTTRQGSTSTPSTPGKPQPTSQATILESPSAPGSYPSLSGVYNGNLQPVFPSPTSGTMIPFTLHIQHQDQMKVSGSFSAPSYKNGRFQNDTFIGVVTPSGQIQFTVIDASGSAALAFNGRITKSSSYPSPLGGDFHSCADVYGATCQASKGPLSGNWTVQQT